MKIAKNIQNGIENGLQLGFALGTAYAVGATMYRGTEKIHQFVGLEAGGSFTLASLASKAVNAVKGLMPAKADGTGDITQEVLAPVADTRVAQQTIDAKAAAV